MRKKRKSTKERRKKKNREKVGKDEKDTNMKRIKSQLTDVQQK